MNNNKKKKFIFFFVSAGQSNETRFEIKYVNDTLQVHYIGILFSFFFKTITITESGIFFSRNLSPTVCSSVLDTMSFVT